ncbi:MAG: GNAT family N-acetyltransferase [Cycloclasticus sp.]
MSIIKMNTRAQIESCYRLMAVLRPHLIESKFVDQLNRQIKQGYQLLAFQVAGRPVALLGYRLIENMVLGKFLYVDDLVTDPQLKRRGYAERLLDSVIDAAMKSECSAIQLDSGFQNLDAHRLYLNKGFQLSAHHFRKPLKHIA